MTAATIRQAADTMRGFHHKVLGDSFNTTTLRAAADQLLAEARNEGIGREEAALLAAWVIADEMVKKPELRLLATLSPGYITAVAISLTIDVTSTRDAAS